MSGIGTIPSTSQLPSQSGRVGDDDLQMFRYWHYTAMPAFLGRADEEVDKAGYVDAYIYLLTHCIAGSACEALVV